MIAALFHVLYFEQDKNNTSSLRCSGSFGKVRSWTKAAR